MVQIFYCYFMCSLHWAYGGHWHRFPPTLQRWVRGWGRETNTPRPPHPTPPYPRPAPACKCGHLWLDGGSLLWNPSLPVFSMWKKWGIVRLLQWERNTHTGGLSHTLSVAGIFLQLTRYFEEQWLLVVFLFPSSPTLDKEYLGITDG